jgi:organic hydroperoxide reductase OsmC/OhrA
MNEYGVTLRWQGSTSEDYPREAEASAPGKPTIATSAGSSFGGDDTHWNPEDLFGASLATCHMLTFLALAKKVRLDVRRYDEDATVTLDTSQKVARVGTVKLSPTIRVAPGTDVAKVVEMFEKAHKYCFIAQSTTAKVILEPRVLDEPMGG